MTSLVVSRDAILLLESGEYRDLLREGACSWSYYPPVVESTQRRRMVPSPVDTCLAVDKSRGHFWFEFEPETDLNLLLDYSCVTNYDVAASTVRRGSHTSLRGEVMDRTGGSGLGDPRPFLPTAGRRDAYGNFFQDEAVHSVETTGNFFGQLAVCGCGEPGCGATYAWLEQARGLLVVEISATGMHTIEVGPFALVRPEATHGE